MLEDKIFSIVGEHNLKNRQVMHEKLRREMTAIFARSWNEICDDDEVMQSDDVSFQEVIMGIQDHIRQSIHSIFESVQPFSLFRFSHNLLSWVVYILNRHL